MADVDGGKGEGEGAYQLTRRNSRPSEEDLPASTLRTLAFDSYAMRKEKVSEYTLDSIRTRVEPGSDLVGEFAEWKFHRNRDRSPSFSDPWDPYAGNRDTIVGTDAPLPDIPTSPNFSSTNHRRTPGEINGMPESVSVPLLTDLHRRSDSHSSDGDVDVGMAGVGTVACRSQLVPDLRQSQIDVDLRHSRLRSDSSGRNSLSLGLPNGCVLPSWPSSTTQEHPRAVDQDVVDIH